MLIFYVFMYWIKQTQSNPIHEYIENHYFCVRASGPENFLCRLLSFQLLICFFFKGMIPGPARRQIKRTRPATNRDQPEAKRPSKHDINGPFVVSVKATNGRNGSMASHFLSQMAHFSVAICLPFKACHEPAVNGPLKASHFTAI